MTRRDKDETWRPLGSLCRELDWSRPRLVYELQNGLPFRTVPPGHEHKIDWHNPTLLSRLDPSASTMGITGPMVPRPPSRGMVRYRILDVGIEVLPPTDAALAGASPSARWAFATVGKLLAEGKIPEACFTNVRGAKAKLARLLEGEAQKAVQAGDLGHPLKASYVEDQLILWGIWPLNSLKQAKA